MQSESRYMLIKQGKVSTKPVALNSQVTVDGYTYSVCLPGNVQANSETKQFLTHLFNGDVGAAKEQLSDANTQVNVEAYVYATCSNLLSYAASFFRNDGPRESAFGLAIASGDIELVKMMLEMGANIHVCDRERKTDAFHLATTVHGSIVSPVFKCLLERVLTLESFDSFYDLENLIAGINIILSSYYSEVKGEDGVLVEDIKNITAKIKVKLGSANAEFNQGAALLNQKAAFSYNCDHMKPPGASLEMPSIHFKQE
jgi:hypothetical protein